MSLSEKITGFYQNYLEGRIRFTAFIIAKELVISSIKEKKFLFALLYFTIIPMLILLLTSNPDVIQTGSGIALYYAQHNTVDFIKNYFFSLIMGQILIVILTADQISGEFEQTTFVLLRTKPVYDSEIVYGKFFGIMSFLMILDVFTICGVFLSNMSTYEAETEAYIGTIDELVVALFIIALLQSLIVSMTLLISSFFSRSLYAILSSMISLFIINIFTIDYDPSSEKLNLFSFPWLIDAIFPQFFYHMDVLPFSIPSLLEFIIGILFVTNLLLGAAILRIRLREVY
ncbi:MAG: hypothetical protein OEZ01_01695 [Candidatus Heimdallarchaeota archaeon]|nr:hypothetical protein [Candidatus Heimdallarchaeota archaeon]MDH5644687.1 hypothetical protein [Candidatus Heimdallarchaeota archaeon]